MNPKLFSFIRRNYRRPLPELKLELMKQGFSSYQIEDALEKVMAEKRRSFLRRGLILLIVLVVISLVVLVFVSFIRPAEELISPEKDVSFVLESEKKQEVIGEQAVEERTVIPGPEPIAGPEKAPVSEENISPVLVSDFRLISSANALRQCSNFDSPDKCLLFVAKDEYNPALCYEIESAKLKNDCFFFFGQSDISYCEQISSARLRQSCEQLGFIKEKV